MLNCLFFRIFPPFVLSGCGLLPANSIWQGAGGPATSQMRCWLLPNGRIFPAVAGILCVGLAYCTCVFLRCPHIGATLAFPVAPHTHSLSRQKAAHSGDTRLTAANGACCERVQGCKPFKALPPYPLAPANARAIDRRGDQKQCRDFVLRSSVSAPRYQAALQGQRLLLLA